MNPWLAIPHQDYEEHMLHPQVKQLQCLNSIIKNKVQLYKPNSVAVYGACTGNGFEHFKSIGQIYALDINNDYLTICQQRHPYLQSKLECLAIDVSNQEVPIGVRSTDLVLCHLFLEYVDINKTLSGICKILKPAGVVNIVIQNNGDNSSVSNTGISSLSPLNQLSNEVSELELLAYPGLSLLKNESYNMPNGKLLHSFDFSLA